MVGSNLILLAPAIPTQTEVSVLIWLVPAMITLFLYGVGQGLVKMWIAEVPPARFCLYFVVAKSLVNLSWYFTHEHPDPFSPEGRTFLLFGIFAFILDGTGWILYFQSIIYGPITIVGTLSAAYPALTVLWAKIFLHESLQNIQYVGVFLVIVCCLGLSYSPFNPNDPDAKVTSKRWIPLAFFALLLWSASQTIQKYSYENLAQASEVNMLLFNTMGGALTLGLYGAIKEPKSLNEFFKMLFKYSTALFNRKNFHVSETDKEWGRSFLPMGAMAGGDLGYIIASSKGPVSIVSPLTGAYPMVTLAFASIILKEHITKLQWVCIIFLLIGIYLTSIEGEKKEANLLFYQANIPAIYERLN